MDDVDEPDEREELFYNNVREKIVSTNPFFFFFSLKKIHKNHSFILIFFISDFSLAVCFVASA